MGDIYYKYGVGKSRHFLNAAEAALQLSLLAFEAEHLFFDQLLKTAVLIHLFKLFEPFDRLLYCLEIG